MDWEVPDAVNLPIAYCPKPPSSEPVYVLDESMTEFPASAVVEYTGVVGLFDHH